MCDVRCASRAVELFGYGEEGTAAEEVEAVEDLEEREATRWRRKVEWRPRWMLMYVLA